MLRQVASFTVGLMLVPLKVLGKVRFEKETSICLNSFADKYVKIYGEYRRVKRVLDEVKNGKLDELLAQLEALRQEIRLERVNFLKESLLFVDPFGVEDAN